VSIAWVALLLCVIWSIPLGIMVLVRRSHVARNDKSYARTVTENHLIAMIAGLSPLDNTSIGHVAATARELNSARDQVEAYRITLVDPNAYPGAENSVHIYLFASGTASHFTSDFSLLAIEASNPNNVGNMTRPLPWRATTGLLNWRTLVIVPIGLISFAIALSLLMLLDRVMWGWRSQRRYLAGLTPEGADANRLLQKLLAIEHPNNATKRLIEDTQDFIAQTSQANGPTPGALAQVREELQELKDRFNGSQQFLRETL
jgi:hypothetical protein